MYPNTENESNATNNTNKVNDFGTFEGSLIKSKLVLKRSSNATMFVQQIVLILAVATPALASTIRVRYRFSCIATYYLTTHVCRDATLRTVNWKASPSLPSNG